jgi:hypothetical protein
MSKKREMDGRGVGEGGDMDGRGMGEGWNRDERDGRDRTRTG